MSTSPIWVHSNGHKAVKGAGAGEGLDGERGGVG